MKPNQQKLTHRRRAAGFTLVELMIALVIIAILASVAIPSYRQYVIRGHRKAAQAVMMDIANRQQQYLLANRAYMDKAAMVTAGYTLPPEVSAYYNWNVTTAAGTPPTFQVQFTPTGSQASDGVITLLSTGEKTPADKWKK